jgi:hypothetical protein
MILPKIDMPELRRPKFRTESPDPQTARSRTDIEPPHWKNLRNDNDEPMQTLLSTDIELLNLASASALKDRLLPNRA